MSNAARHLPLAPAANSTNADGVNDTLGKATSHDLVFAVVGQVGAGPGWVARLLADGLKSHNYEPTMVAVSDLIAVAARGADSERFGALATMTPPSGERTLLLQEAGNWLREKYGRTFTAALAVRRMHEERQKRSVGAKPVAFLLDSLKNPEEVYALRKVYGRSFYLVSVVCGPSTRKSRLLVKYKNDRDKVSVVMERDEAQEALFGQQVRKTLHLGDFFVNNEISPKAEGTGPVDQALARFLEVVFASEVVRPTRDERGMFAAWSAALRSSCMSRQVGAAILDPSGQLIASGTNDVPRFGGGLYEEDEAGAGEDHRCFRYPKIEENEPKGFCRNDKVKKDILKQAVEQLREANVIRDSVADGDIIGALRLTPVNDLIEFSRAVHAETDAIVSLARSGGPSTQGGTLYCTTYPCHSCARLIVAAGIRDVVYIEPYVKSRAVALHDDAIVEATRAPSAEARRVHFRLFTGVAPRRYAALFEKRDELKRDGRLSLRDPADALHTDPIFTKSHLDFEQAIANHVEQITAVGK